MAGLSWYIKHIEGPRLHPERPISPSSSEDDETDEFANDALNMLKRANKVAVKTVDPDADPRSQEEIDQEAMMQDILDDAALRCENLPSHSELRRNNKAHYQTAEYRSDAPEFLRMSVQKAFAGLGNVYQNGEFWNKTGPLWAPPVDTTADDAVNAAMGVSATEASTSSRMAVYDKAVAAAAHKIATSAEKPLIEGEAISFLKRLAVFSVNTTTHGLVDAIPDDQLTQNAGPCSKCHRFMHADVMNMLGAKRHASDVKRWRKLVFHIRRKSFPLIKVTEDKNATPADIVNIPGMVDEDEHHDHREDVEVFEFSQIGLQDYLCAQKFHDQLQEDSLWKLTAEFLKEYIYFSWRHQEIVQMMCDMIQSDDMDLYLKFSCFVLNVRQSKALVYNEGQLDDMGVVSTVGSLVQNNSQITSLNLSAAGLNVDTARLLAASIPQIPCLASIDLSNNAICGHGDADDTEAVEHVCNAIHRALQINHGLCDLKFSDNQIGVNVTSTIGNFLQQKLPRKYITKLDISNNAICSVVWDFRRAETQGDYNARGLRTLCTAFDMGTALHEINFANCCLRLTGLKILIAGLRTGHTKVRTLNLAGNKVGEQGARELSYILASSEIKLPLTNLNLDNNALLQRGAKALAMALARKKTPVKVLSLQMNTLCGLDEYGDGKYDSDMLLTICKLIADDSTVEQLDIRDNFMKQETKRSWEKRDDMFPDGLEL
jgi:Ran GTPase-activating protein (RanGAP) involved in mRNA processing and transport